MSYQRLDGLAVLTLGEAIKAAKDDHRSFRRKKWPPGHCVYLAHYDQEKADIRSFLMLDDSTGKYEPWHPSSSDLLAGDYQLVWP